MTDRTTIALPFQVVAEATARGTRLAFSIDGRTWSKLPDVPIGQTRQGELTLRPGLQWLHKHGLIPIPPNPDDIIEGEVVAPGPHDTPAGAVPIASLEDLDRRLEAAAGDDDAERAVWRLISLEWIRRWATFRFRQLEDGITPPIPGELEAMLWDVLDDLLDQANAGVTGLDAPLTAGHHLAAVQPLPDDEDPGPGLLPVDFTDPEV